MLPMKGRTIFDYVVHLLAVYETSDSIFIILLTDM